MQSSEAVLPGRRETGGENGNAALTGSRRRTWLVTPGDAPGRFANSVSSRADVAVLDLEDAVPAEGKDVARASVVAFLGQHHCSPVSSRGVLGVRINAPGTLDGLKDLVELAATGLRPTVLVVPKVEAARDVELVAQVLSDVAGGCEVWALIETPRGLQHLSDIVQCGSLSGVSFGAADYAAAAGCSLTSKAMWYPKAAVAAAAAAAGLPAVDGPYFGLDDLDGLRQDTEEAVELGFIGKIAVHPRQLSVIEAAFHPSTHDLQAARAIVRAAEGTGGGITKVDGRMVGPPLVAAARALTARAGDVPAPYDQGDTQ
ncbi:HpcH/HpaI aldolase/citrate lyase family protein [Streptomyces sp. NPDC056160]|uniref:HpcH/HpaI aldolase/citrate lyase family protein n=1 Tax=Streptomyces sp. NPDC056160 TaxID=3345731 RepID=UPI0035E32E8D